jgi:uncharacterized protein HemX
MIALVLKYWKELVMLVVTVGLGAVIFVLHLELSHSQTELNRYQAQSAIMAADLREQNASIARFRAAERQIQQRITQAENANKTALAKTRIVVVKINKTKIPPGCTAAMSFLRLEATRLIR